MAGHPEKARCGSSGERRPDGLMAHLATASIELRTSSTATQLEWGSRASARRA
jgi:hypothetical protein